MSNLLIIPRASLRLATDGTITPENTCSPICGSCPTVDRCEDYGCSGGCIDTDYVVKRSDGAFLSLAELRRQLHVDIATTVAHIRQLCALEAGV